MEPLLTSIKIQFPNLLLEMKENNNKNQLKKLLDRLQEDSWQLELLVSGFTIFGLFHASGPVEDAFQKALYEGAILKDLYQTASLSIDILIINLIIHLVLRGIWIGALGLRSVSGEVDIDSLIYSARFTNYLNKKIGSFDTYIERLEKLCSIIFAISFLLIFYVAAFYILVQINLFFGTLANVRGFTIVGAILTLLLLIGAGLTFFDYVTQGLLKRNKWVSKLYFPFYWVFSYLTLSFLYRPLYYNLLDNRFGRKVSLVLLPFYISILFISSIYKEQSAFVGLFSSRSSSILAKSGHYEDLVKKDYNINVLTIQSKVIRDPYIKVNIPITNAVESKIIEFNNDLIPFQNKRRYKSYITLVGMGNNSSNKVNTDSLYQEYLNTFERIYLIKIDSIACKTEFVINIKGDEMKRSINFETYINTNYLTEGKHVLTYSRYKHPDTDSLISIKKIPFWFYKN